MPHYKILIIPIVLSGLFGMSLPVMAETLSIINQPANSTEGVLRPARGLTQEQVESTFGNPLEKIAPVGEPPISRWVYEKYTVYFEGNYVIHSAIHHKAPAP